MTEKLYDADSHIFEFNATVVSCEKCGGGYAVILDRTAFFPEGGGQPSDRGYIDGAAVSDVKLSEEIVHFTDRPLEAGAQVKGVIDRERRLDFMCQHSAEHIVSGIVHERFGFENVGFHLSEETVTLDFNGMLSEKQIAEIELEANRRVRRNVKFKAYYPSAEELERLVYRSKKEINGAVRIVEIEDTDRCACCAPHVKQAAEIGVIYLEAEGKMRGGIRLALKAGERAVSAHRKAADALGGIGALLSARSGGERAAVEKMLAALEEEKRKTAAAERQLVRLTAESIPDGKRAVFTELSGDAALQLADLLFKRSGGIETVFSPSGGGFKFVACGNEKELSEEFEKFKAVFPVRGGGRDGLRRGSVEAQRNALEEFFK